MSAPCSEADIRRGALLIRARPGDSADARPIEPCENVDSSPDLILLGGADDGTAMVDAEHTVRVRVTNGGARPIEQIDVEAWVCDAAAGTPPLGRLDPPGRMTGYFPGPLEPGETTLIACSPKWTPSLNELGLGDRLCLAANVSSEAPSDGAELTEGSVLKLCCDTHHAQRNIVLRPKTIITTVAGTGVQGFSGDGGPAIAGQLGSPFGIAVTADGGFLISDSSNDRVRKVSRDGTIVTVAGGGDESAVGDGIAATAAFISKPAGLATTPDGGFLVAEQDGNRVRKVLADGTITTVAGGGPLGTVGDGGPAVEAHLRGPMGVAAMADGGFLVADIPDDRVRRVWPDGTIDTAAGSDSSGFTGDGVPAAGASLATPYGVAAMPDGGFLIAELVSRRVRRVLPDGTITTAAGTGVEGSSGDGGPATAAQLDRPCSVAVAATGEIVIADIGGGRVRQIATDGTITTVAGTGESGPSSGDGGAPTAARLMPFVVAVRPDGGILIADAANHVIRLVAAAPAP